MLSIINSMLVEMFNRFVRALLTYAINHTTNQKTHELAHKMKFFSQYTVKSRLSLIVRVNVVLNRTVVVDRRVLENWKVWTGSTLATNSKFLFLTCGKPWTVKLLKKWNGLIISLKRSLHFPEKRFTFVWYNCPIDVCWKHNVILAWLLPKVVSFHFLKKMHFTRRKNLTGLVCFKIFLPCIIQLSINLGIVTIS